MRPDGPWAPRRVGPDVGERPVHQSPALVHAVGVAVEGKVAPTPVVTGLGLAAEVHGPVGDLGVESTSTDPGRMGYPPTQHPTPTSSPASVLSPHLGLCRTVEPPPRVTTPPG